MTINFFVQGVDETECIYDYLATGRERIASATRQAIQEYEAVKENIEPGEISYLGVWNQVCTLQN